MTIKKGDWVTAGASAILSQTEASTPAASAFAQRREVAWMERGEEKPCKPVKNMILN